MTQLRFLIVAGLTLLLLAGCHSDGPDFGPIRDGLRSVGICLVAAASVIALAAVINGGNNSGKGGGKHE